MVGRSRLFDDLAGVAGGALSAVVGIREEAEAALHSQLDELIRRLDLAGRGDLDAEKDLATNARVVTEDVAARLVRLAERVEAIEARLAGRENPPAPEA